MINFRMGKKPLESPRPSGLRVLLWCLFFLTLLLVILGIYCQVRYSAMRVSADYYYPFLKMARGTENAAADQVLMMQSKTKLAHALKKLMEENTLLHAERTMITDLKRENAELRTLLSLKEKGSFRPVFAEVLTRDPMTWQEQFTIDKGSRDGIEPGNLVVTPVYSVRKDTPPIAVIGKVKSVTGHTALVSTILSRGFQLSVSLPDSKSTGILEGARDLSEMQAVLNFLSLKNTVLSAGQLVYTNAFSGNSPPGLVVGRIVSSVNAVKESKRNRLYPRTVVRPFESPAEVRFIAVFVKEKK